MVIQALYCYLYIKQYCYFSRAYDVKHII